MRFTWPVMVRDILRLPLRAVVASSSATRSSRSAQQSPPRSAALADGIATPPANKPIAAMRASRLPDLTSPPIYSDPEVRVQERPNRGFEATENFFEPICSVRFSYALQSVFG